MKGMVINMRNKIIFFAIIIICLSTLVFQAFYVKKACDDTLKDVGSLRSAIEQNNQHEINSEFNKVYVNWEKHQKFLNIFVSHKIVNEVSTTLAQIEFHIEKNNKEKTLEYIIFLENHIKEILMNEKITIQNIF